MGEIYSEEFLGKFQAADSSSMVSALASMKDPQVLRFRDQIERWFGEIPDAARGIMKQPLRSNNDAEFYPAFFSLVIHNFLKGSGWSVDFRPGARTTPTFQVKTPDATFDLETTVVLPRETVYHRQAAIDRLIHSIDRIDSDFSIAVHIRRWLPPNFDPTPVRDSLTRWLEGLIGDDTFATKRAQYLDDPVDIEFAVLGKRDKNAGGIISMWLTPLDSEHDFQGATLAIDQAVAKAKASFKEVARPFVVALCHADTWGMAENTLVYNLYGKPRGVRAHSGQEGGRRKIFDYSRTFRNALFNKAGNECLSAVLLLERCWHKDEVCYDVRVLHNPWAAHPLGPALFGEVPQLIPIETDEGDGPLLTWRNHKGQIVSLRPPTTP